MISPFLSHVALLERLDRAALDAASYAGSDAATAQVALIDALMEMYLQDLCEVPTEKLSRMQGYVAQLRELRGVVSGTVKTNGRL